MIVRVLGTALLIALAVAGLLRLSSEQIGTTPRSQATPAMPNPGYSARDATLIETGADGRPMYTVHAATVRQVPESQVVNLTLVQLLFRDPKGQLWHGSSDRGLILDEAARVDMIGNVKLWGLLPGTDEDAHISTDALHVNTQTEVITTQDPVMLDWSRQHLRARGMIVRLKSSQVALESDVYGVFLPQ